MFDYQLHTARFHYTILLYYLLVRGYVVHITMVLTPQLNTSPLEVSITVCSFPATICKTSFPYKGECLRYGSLMKIEDRLNLYMGWVYLGIFINISYNLPRKSLSLWGPVYLQYHLGRVLHMYSVQRRNIPSPKASTGYAREFV